MKVFDAKLFYGCKIGQGPEILSKLREFFPMKGEFDLYKYISYLNTQIPDDIYVDVSYPLNGCDIEKISFHLNMISKDVLSITEVNNLPRNGYNYMLNLLELEPLCPMIYIEEYKYE
jgi:hypothetical protein